MSASQDKKRRQTERMEGTDKRTLAEREAAQKAKKERTRWGIVGAIAAMGAFLIHTIEQAHKKTPDEDDKPEE